MSTPDARLINNNTAVTHIKELERMVQIYSEDINNFDILIQLINTRDSTNAFYALKILEMRQNKIVEIIKTQNTDILDKQIAFLKFCINFTKEFNPFIFVNKLGDVCAIVAAYYYPFYFPDFFEIISAEIRIGNSIGISMMRCFISEISNSLRISPERAIELRKLTMGHITTIVKFLVEDFQVSHESLKNNKFISIVDIMTSLLFHSKFRPFLVDFVLLHGHVYYYETFDFFSNLLDYQADRATIISIYNFITAKAFNSEEYYFFVERISELIFVTFNPFNFRKEYMYEIDILKFLVEQVKDEEYKIKGLHFFGRCSDHFKNQSQYLKEILFPLFNKLFRIYTILELQVENKSDPMDILENAENKMTKIEDFITRSIISSQEITTLFQYENQSVVPLKFQIILLKYHPSISNLQLETAFFKCYKLFLLQIPNCADFINQLDLSNKEHMKLVEKILEKYKPKKEEIMSLIYKIKNDQHNRLLATCIHILQSSDIKNYNETVTALLNEKFRADWYESNIDFLAECFFKRVIVSDVIINSFLSFFLSSQCKEFSIYNKSIIALSGLIEINRIIPPQIISKINIDFRDYKFLTIKTIIKHVPSILSPFTNQYLPLQILERLKEEYNNQGQRELIQSLKVFVKYYINRIKQIKKNLNISEQDIYEVNFNTHMLINSLDIPDDYILTTIFNFFDKEKIEFDSNLCLYKVLSLYQYDELYEHQKVILSFAAFIINKFSAEDQNCLEDKLSVLKVIPNTTITELQNVRLYLKKDKIQGIKALDKLLEQIKGKNKFQIAKKHIPVGQYGLIKKEKSPTTHDFNLNEALKK